MARASGILVVLLALVVVVFLAARLISAVPEHEVSPDPVIDLPRPGGGPIAPPAADGSSDDPGDSSGEPGEVPQPWQAIGAFPTELRQHLRSGVVNRNNAASGNQVDALVEALAVQLEARSTGDYERYPVLVESAYGGEWISAESPEFARFARWYEAFTGAVPEGIVDGRSAVIASLEQLSNRFDEGLLRFESYLEHEESGALAIARIRADGQVIDLASEGLTDNEVERLLAQNGAPGLRFYRPKRLATELIQERGSALVAVGNTVVRLGSGDLVNAQTFWVWDPDEARWGCEMVVRKGEARIFFPF